MSQFTSPASTPAGMPGVNNSHRGKFAAATFDDITAFSNAVTPNQVGYSADNWPTNYKFNIATEPVQIQRFWDGSSGRNFVVPNGRIFTLNGTTNQVWPTSGAPSGSSHQANDYALDGSTGLLYNKINSGAWDSGTQVFNATSTQAATGTIALSSANYTVNENGGTISISATRTNGSAGAATVHYATSNGTGTAGTDYTAASGTLSWADNDAATKTFAIPILDRQLTTGTKTVNIALSAVTGATLGTSTAVLTINDNDTASVLTLGVAHFVNENGNVVETDNGDGTFTVGDQYGGHTYNTARGQDTSGKVANGDFYLQFKVHHVNGAYGAIVGVAPTTPTGLVNAEAMLYAAQQFSNTTNGKDNIALFKGGSSANGDLGSGSGGHGTDLAANSGFYARLARTGTTVTLSYATTKNFTSPTVVDTLSGETVVPVRAVMAIYSAGYTDDIEYAGFA